MADKEYAKIGRWQLVRRANLAGLIQGFGTSSIAMCFLFIINGYTTESIVGLIFSIIIFALGASYEAHLFERAVELDVPDIANERIRPPPNYKQAGET